MKRKTTSVLLMGCMVGTLIGCSGLSVGDTYTPLAGLDTGQKVSLTIAVPYETNKALNTIANAFMDRYDNVDIQLQYVEDYDKNAVALLKENSIDMILQKDTAYTEYTVKDEESGEETPTGKTTDDFFYNFAADTEIDFSQTTPDITENYRHARVDEEGNEIIYQYSYPLGGETRGVFVNKTLLAQYGLQVPGNYTEFTACCETLRQNGLIPIQGGGDTAAYGLGLAPAANAVVHDAAALEAMKNAEPGVSNEFEDTLQKIYTLATRRYFDYKAVEETGFYTVTNELGQAESFLGLQTDPETLEITKPENNYGNVAFMPYISSTETVIKGLIEEYELDTEIEFICSPLNEEGTSSPVYITPYYGICANKNSENLLWIREFVNFLFQEKNNRMYAEEASIIPNTQDALSYVADEYHVDIKKDVTLCGQIRFSDDYNGFSPLASVLRDTLKCSAQKYMLDLNKDAEGSIQYETDEQGRQCLYLGSGEATVPAEYMGEEDPNMPGYAFCSLQYYLDKLEEEFAKYRGQENAKE